MAPIEDNAQQSEATAASIAASGECGDVDTVAPAAKRVRFSTVVSANDVTRLIIITGDVQVEEQSKDAYFHPRFTYHAFGTDESIQGYDGLKISVCFNAFDFSAYLKVQYTEKESSADDIVSKISSSLPEGFTQDRAAFMENVRQTKLNFSPPGKLVDSYIKAVDGNDRRFEIYEVELTGNEAAQALHRKMQTMALWFIEGADGIDVTDPRWVVYLTYERLGEVGGENGSLFCPVGYITLFKFFNPLGRKVSSTTTTATNPERIETHRICQVLIFPTHQRQGHGEMLVQCISARAVANDNVYELTVEDPVPAFSQLRNVVDVKNCLKHNFFSRPPSDGTDVPAGHGTNKLQASDIQAVQETLKITQKQVQLCYETLKLRFTNKSDDAQCKQYRLEVKKRLFKLHAEELEGMASAERRKAFLEAEFQALDAQYAQALAKVGAQPGDNGISATTK